MATELFVLGLFELTACFCVAILAISYGPLVSDELILHYSAALAICLVVTSIAIGSYRGEAFRSLWRIGFKVLLASLAALAAGSAVVILVDGSTILADDISRHALSRGCLACLAFLLGARLVFAYAYLLGVFSRRVVVVGAAAAVAPLVDTLQSPAGHNFDLLAQFDPPQSATASQALVTQCRSRDVWGIVLAEAAAPQQPLAAVAADSGMALISSHEFHETYLHRIDLASLTTPPAAGTGNAFSGHWLEAVLHRLLDIGLSLVLLAFTFPLMFATALAIRLDSPGLALYRQERVGLHGVPFTLYKFRSMRVDAEASGPVWAKAQDNRVTRIGQFIRLTRIDELPQLFNVLRGEMSFIGPRPERPVFVAQLEAAIPFYACRAEVKPGLTGWAQVNYPYGASVEDARMKLSYDLYYVKHRSIYLDVTILFATIRVILFQEGAR